MLCPILIRLSLVSVLHVPENFVSYCNSYPQIGQLKISLKSVLDQWSLYKRAFEEINGYLMEGRYSVSRFCLLTGSLEAALLQVQSLQVCWDEAITEAFMILA